MQFELTARPPMTPIDASMIAAQPSMSKALALCQTVCGKPDSHFYGDDGIVKDQAQWSRIMGPSNHCFPHDKLNTFMDLARNEAPMLWLLHSRGYDLHSLRKLETETERKLRETEEKLEHERAKNRVLMEAIGGRVSA